MNTIIMEERILAEGLVLKLFPDRALGVQQWRNLRTTAKESMGSQSISRNRALENPALVAKSVVFWKDYGLKNPEVKHIAMVVIRVLGIHPQLQVC